MKKFIIVICLFMILNLVNVGAYSTTLSQGFYNIKDTKLQTGIQYKVQNTSPTGKSVLLIFNDEQLLEEFIRLEPNSQEYILKPLDYGYIIIVVGAGNIIFK